MYYSLIMCTINFPLMFIKNCKCFLPISEARTHKHIMTTDIMRFKNIIKKEKWCIFWYTILQPCILLKPCSLKTPIVFSNWNFWKNITFGLARALKDVFSPNAIFVIDIILSIGLYCPGSYYIIGTQLYSIILNSFFIHNQNSHSE